MESIFIVTSTSNGILKVFNNKPAAEHYVILMKKNNPEIEGIHLEMWHVNSK